MASTYSFDVVSKYDISELDHAIDQAKRELANRYDFKGTKASVEYTDAKKESLVIEGESEYQLGAIIDMIRTKLAKRELSQKLLDVSQTPQTAGMILRQTIKFVSGLDQDKAKLITKLLRTELPKVKTQIQGEEVRVSSASKDELQTAMTLIKNQDFDFPVSFDNFR